MEKTIEIPEGYEARIEGNKVILEPKESEEQMDALKVSSEYEPCIKNREYPKSLYADLKKL